VFSLMTSFTDCLRTSFTLSANGEFDANVETGEVEEWVVAEAARPVGNFEDQAFDDAFGGEESFAVAAGVRWVHADVRGGSVAVPASEPL